MNEILKESTETLEQKATVESLVDKLRSINVTILKGRLERGAYLLAIKQEKLYVNYDSYCVTWNNFLEAINVPRETARQDMKIYEKFAEYLNANSLWLQKIPYERLVRLLPVAENMNNNDDVANILYMAYESNRNDFDNNLKELKGLIPTDTCKSHFENPQIYEKCTVCGDFRKKDN